MLCCSLYLKKKVTAPVLWWYNTDVHYLNVNTQCGSITVVIEPVTPVDKLFQHVIIKGGFKMMFVGKGVVVG